MKPRFYNQVTVGVALFMGWTFLTAIQCGDDITGPPTIQACQILYDSDFPIDGYLHLNKPARCPLAISQSNLKVPYAATADLPGTVTYGFYQYESFSWNGFSAFFFGTAAWSQGSNGRYLVTITGDYYAASAGFKSDGTGWDDIRHGFHRNNSWTYATSRIDYYAGVPYNNISTPGTVDPGSYYPVSATTNDPLLTSPIRWSWYVDGSHVGTTDDPNFNVWAGPHGTEQHVEVMATDDNGHSVWGDTFVLAVGDCSVETC